MELCQGSFNFAFQTHQGYCLCLGIECHICCFKQSKQAFGCRLIFQVKIRPYTTNEVTILHEPRARGVASVQSAKCLQLFAEFVTRSPQDLQLHLFIYYTSLMAFTFGTGTAPATGTSGSLFSPSATTQPTSTFSFGTPSATTATPTTSSFFPAPSTPAATTGTFSFGTGSTPR